MKKGFTVSPKIYEKLERALNYSMSGVEQEITEYSFSSNFHILWNTKFDKGSNLFNVVIRRTGNGLLYFINERKSSDKIDSQLKEYFIIHNLIV